jgi:NitT/TauT family transport system substrate-binding protein
MTIFRIAGRDAKSYMTSGLTSGIRTGLASLMLAGAYMATTSSAFAQDKVSIAVPGIPPVFGGVPAYVARDQGFFKKYNLEVDIKPIATGVAAASAVISGTIDLSFSPSQYTAATIANANAPLQAIWGLDNDDWLLGSTDPTKTDCNSLKGQGVAVDAKGGARWLQLNTILLVKCKLRIDVDVKTVPMSSNGATAMAAGQLIFGILHYDDVALIQRQSNKKVHTMATLAEVSPGIHYLMLVGHRDRMAKRKDVYARVVAAIADAADFMHDPKNLQAAAKSAAPTQRPVDAAADAIAYLNKILFFPKGTPGLDKDKIEKAVANQVRVGKLSKGKSGISPEKQGPSYEQVADLSYWNAAQKLRGK